MRIHKRDAYATRDGGLAFTRALLRRFPRRASLPTEFAKSLDNPDLIKNAHAGELFAVGKTPGMY